MSVPPQEPVALATLASEPEVRQAPPQPVVAVAARPALAAVGRRAARVAAPWALVALESRARPRPELPAASAAERMPVAHLGAEALAAPAAFRARAPRAPQDERTAPAWESRRLPERQAQAGQRVSAETPAAAALSVLGAQRARARIASEVAPWDAAARSAPPRLLVPGAPSEHEARRRARLQEQPQRASESRASVRCRNSPVRASARRA